MSDFLLPDLETPALCLDIRTLQERIGLIASRMQAHHQKWRPRADWHLLPPLAKYQCTAGACGISLDSLPQVARFASAGLMNIHLAQPPVGSRQWPQIFQTFPNLELSVSCDHYAQAEELSDIAGRLGRRIPVLVELNTGRNRFGVRPGLDSRDLARGISRLPGIEIRGLSAHLGVITPAEKSIRQSQSALGILEESRDCLLQDGLCGDVVSVAVEGVLDPVLTSGLVTELQTGNLFSKEIDSTGGHTAFPAPLFVVSSIFSRSKLERAVLDIGQSRLGVRSPEGVEVRSTASGRPLPDARVESLGWESLTLDLGPDSRDVVIGDRVLVNLHEGAFAVRLFPAIHVVEDGNIKEIWPAPHGRE